MPETGSRRVLMGMILIVGVVLSAGCASSAQSTTIASSGVLDGVAIDVHAAPN